LKSFDFTANVKKKKIFDKEMEQNHNVPSKSKKQIFCHLRSILSCHRIILPINYVIKTIKI